MSIGHCVRVTLRGITDGARSVVRFADHAELAAWIQARVQHGKGKFATL